LSRFVIAVWAADGGHVDDLSVDEFDAIGVGQNAGLGHLVVRVDVEPVACRGPGTLEDFTHGFSLRGGSLPLAVAGANAPRRTTQRHDARRTNRFDARRARGAEINMILCPVPATAFEGLTIDK
jgi:hypothetical protein